MSVRKSLKSSVKEVLKAFADGEIVIVVDDHRRENEGDLIVAAERVTPKAISFMARFGRGLICVAMDREQLRRLGLSHMTADGREESYHTAFMESVDAKNGVTTGISAYDRALTVEVLVSDESGPTSIVRPGHLFPLEAAENGVLGREGHTEAAVDLARLAGLKPAGVICEIMRDDGMMARADELDEFSREHELKMISIADIIAYRKQTERLVKPETTVNLPTPFGMFKMRLYHSLPENEHHIALIMGEPEKEKTPLVRVHSECLTGDVFGSRRCDCGAQLHEAMNQIGELGCGVLIYLRQEGRGIGLKHKIHAYALQEQGLDTVDANTELGFEPDSRDYCAAAQILQDLNIDNLVLLTNNPKKVEGLKQYGITIAKRAAIAIEPTEYNEFYLETKKRRLGHLL